MGAGKRSIRPRRCGLTDCRATARVNGKNLTIDYRFSEPADRLSASVADLVAVTPDVLILAGPQAAVALKSSTDKIPILFVGVADPVGLGLVGSLSGQVAI